jgi:hypothetical protein
MTVYIWLLFMRAFHKDMLYEDPRTPQYYKARKIPIGLDLTEISRQISNISANLDWITVLTIVDNDSGLVRTTREWLGLSEFANLGFLWIDAKAASETCLTELVLQQWSHAAECRQGFQCLRFLHLHVDFNFSNSVFEYLHHFRVLTIVHIYSLRGPEEMDPSSKWQAVAGNEVKSLLMNHYQDNLNIPSHPALCAAHAFHLMVTSILKIAHSRPILSLQCQSYNHDGCSAWIHRSLDSGWFERDGFRTPRDGFRPPRENLKRTLNVADAQGRPFKLQIRDIAVKDTGSLLQSFAK